MTHYEQCCARECQWCAKGIPFCHARHSHADKQFHGNDHYDDPANIHEECTAPTLAEFAERCAAALALTELALGAGMDLHDRCLCDDDPPIIDSRSRCLYCQMNDARAAARRALGLEK